MKKLILGFSIIVLSSCSTVQINDPSIKVHWIKKGEPAPFKGVLLNKYTFYELLKKANQCNQAQ